MKASLKFLGSMMAGAFIGHATFSLAVSAWIGQGTTHRLFNLRNIDDPTLWGPLTRLFVEGQAIDDPRPKILMFGSSVTWGYSWPERDVFSWHMQQELDGYQVLNVAIIGRDLESIIDLECNLKQLNVDIDIVTLELNLFNLKLGSTPPGEAIGCNEVGAYVALGGPFNYAHFTLLHPFGIPYFRMFWNQYEYPQEERSFSWNELPDSYFPNLNYFLKNREQLDRLISSAIEGANSISESVVAFVAPTLREGLILSEYNPADLQELADLVISSCTKTAQSSCLDPGLDLPRENFGNLTHLNLSGHESFARWLLKQLNRP
jgi:hypothetical protein